MCKVTYSLFAPSILLYSNLFYLHHGRCRGDNCTSSHCDTLQHVEILPSQRPLTRQHTTLKRDRHSCPRRDSNPQSQQASGCRPSPYTARPLGLTWMHLCFVNMIPTISNHSHGVERLVFAMDMRPFLSCRNWILVCYLNEIHASWGYTVMHTHTLYFVDTLTIWCTCCII